MTRSTGIGIAIALRALEKWEGTDGRVIMVALRKPQVGPVGTQAWVMRV